MLPARRSRRSSSGGVGGLVPVGERGSWGFRRAVNAALAALGPVRIVVRTAGPGYPPDAKLSGGREDRTVRDPAGGTVVTFVTSQLSGSQDRPSFLPGTGGRLGQRG